MIQHREVLPTALQPMIIAQAPEPPLVDAYWVVPGRFLAGPYPGGYGGHRAAKGAVEDLLDVGVNVFLDLTEADEVASYAHYLIGQARHVRLAIPDFDTPTPSQMTEILDEIDRALQQDEVVYLHCFAGLGRTGTVVGCYLVRHGLSADDALDAIATLRGETMFPDSASPQTEAQRRMVRSWT